jgi:hypothetical protein
MFSAMFSLTFSTIRIRFEFQKISKKYPSGLVYPAFLHEVICGAGEEIDDI